MENHSSASGTKGEVKKLLKIISKIKLDKGGKSPRKQKTPREEKTQRERERAKTRLKSTRIGDKKNLPKKQ